MSLIVLATVQSSKYTFATRNPVSVKSTYKQMRRKGVRILDSSQLESAYVYKHKLMHTNTSDLLNIKPGNNFSPINNDFLK